MIEDTKILVFSTRHYEWLPKARLHLKFLRGLQRFCKEYRVIDKDAASTYLSLKSVQDQYKPDVLIVYTSYDLPEKCLTSVDCTKILVETDFHIRQHGKEKNWHQWYVGNKFDLILQRGAFKCGRSLGAPVIWLPFSADEKEFHPGKKRKSNKIGFAGSVTKNPKLYVQRKKAISLLEDAKLIVKKKRRISNYEQFVRSTAGFLTSAGLKSPHGKVFEVMASETALLSPSFFGERSLFGDEECFVKYKHDCSDVVEQARRIVGDRQYRERVAKNGYEAFLRNHTHEKRLVELVEHINGVLSGRDVIARWEAT